MTLAWGMASPQVTRGKAIGVPSQTSRRLVWCVLAIVALSPLPFGSNRPFFWALWATVAGCLSTVFFWSLRRNGRAPMPSFPGARPLLVLIIAYLCFLVVEILPIGPYLPASIMPALPLDLRGPTLSVHWGETWYALLRALTYLALFLVTAQVVGKLRLQRFFLTSMLVVSTAYALYGLVALRQLGDTILFFEKWTYQGSATATFVNRNSFATFLAFGSIIGSVLMVSTYEERAHMQARAAGLAAWLGRVPWIAAICTATIVVALVSTQSRMGTAVAIGGMLVAATLAMSRRRGLGSAVALLAIAVAAIAVLLWLYGGELGERFGTLEHSTGVRLTLYRQVVAMIESRPLLGFGGGTFPLVFPLFHQPALNVDLVWDRAHSTYLSLWSDHGLLFGSIPMLVGGMLIVRCVRQFLLSRETGWEAPLAAAVACGAAAMHSLVDFSLEIQANAIMLVVLLATALACRFPRQAEETLTESGETKADLP